MAHPDIQQIQRFSDGELDKRRARDVEAHIRDCPKCTVTVNQLEKIGQLVQLAAHQINIDVNMDGFADAVLERISDEKAEQSVSWREKIKVWLGEFVRYQRRIWVPTFATAGVAGATLLVVIGVAQQQQISASDLPSTPLSSDSASMIGAGSLSSSSNVMPGAGSLPPGSNVLSVSFGSSVDGALFQLEGKDGSTTAVIWVDEGKAERMEVTPT